MSKRGPGPKPPRAFGTAASSCEPAVCTVLRRDETRVWPSNRTVPPAPPCLPLAQPTQCPQSFPPYPADHADQVLHFLLMLPVDLGHLSLPFLPSSLTFQVFLPARPCLVGLRVRAPFPPPPWLRVALGLPLVPASQPCHRYPVALACLRLPLVLSSRRVQVYPASLAGPGHLFRPVIPSSRPARGCLGCRRCPWVQGAQEVQSLG